MKHMWYISLLTCILLLIAMLPSAASGEVLQPAGDGKTVSSGYWSNYVIGPDYSIPESAFNPPDRSDWDQYYGSLPDAGSGSLGALLPFDEAETDPVNTSSASSDVLPASLYPRVITPVPINPFASGTQAIQIPAVPYLPTIDTLPSLFTGQSAGTLVIPDQATLVIFPTADLPVLPDTGTGATASSDDAGQETGSSLFISDLDVRDEYVKITNNGLTPVSMTGWKIMSGSTRRSITFIDWSQGNGQTFTFVLYPLTTATIHYGKNGAVTATDLYWPSAQDYWNDAGDTALLYDPDGNLVSSFTR